MARLTDKFAQQARNLGGAEGQVAAANSNPTSPLGAGGRDVLSELPLSQIHPDPAQPRRDLGDLSELTASIREMGVVQPIIVSVEGYESYRIVAGERRYTAAAAAGLARVPAIVRTIEEHQRLAIQLIENLHRKDLSPFEEAGSYHRLIEEFGLRQETLARRLGKSQEAVSETLRLLTLPENIRAEFAVAQHDTNGRISRSVLLEIARRPTKEQPALWEEAKRGELTVRKLRAARGGSPANPIPEGQSSRLRRAASFRYSIILAEQDALVTVAFADVVVPTPSTVIAALEEALAIEKAREVAA